MRASDWDLPGLLARRLALPLRRLGSQPLFAPELSYGRHAMPPLPDTRPAAVLILLYPHRDEWMLPLTVRPPTLSAHAGQISLPGGSAHADETCERAALRECEEELGVPAGYLTVLGRLTPLFVYNSNYYVTPCVASMANRPEFRPNPAEVADLLELPVRELANPDRWGEHWIHRRAVRFRAPHLFWNGRRIWGATRMILAEFAAVVSELSPSSQTT